MDITVSDEVSQEYHALVKNILCNREFLKLSLYTHPPVDHTAHAQYQCFLPLLVHCQEAGM